jgi:hypothetical protein
MCVFWITARQSGSQNGNNKVAAQLSRADNYGTGKNLLPVSKS